MTDPKPAISPARLAANQANALRSTGPRSDEGKSRSRLNGLKHGLRAETVILPGEDPEALQYRLDAWTADLRPRTAIERHLVETAVQASWRMDRCLAVETAVLSQQVLRAGDDFDERIVAEVGRLTPALADDPATTVRQLRQTSVGCRWLIGRWESLGVRLESWPTLEITEKHLAFHLMGKQPRQLFDDPTVREWTVAHLAAVIPATDTESICALLWPDRPEGMHPVEFERRVGALCATFPDAPSALAFMVEEIRLAIADLAERAELLLVREERDRALALDRAAFDESKAGSARLRYETAHHRVYRGALRDLHAEQKRRLDREAEEPADEARPPVTAAPTEPRPVEARPPATLPASAPTEPRDAARSLPAAPTEPRETARTVAIEAELTRPAPATGRLQGLQATRAA